MTNETPRATVLRFVVPVSERQPAMPAAVRRLQQSPLTRDLIDSLAVRDLAVALHEADRFAGRAPVDVSIEQLTPEYTSKLTERATIALQLGDKVKRAVADERALQSILFGIQAGLHTGLIAADSPLALLSHQDMRQLAKLALLGGLDYLAGRKPG